MVNPELQNYVEQQLAAGVSKEDITRSLLSNGWQTADIEAALPNAVPQTAGPSVSVPTAVRTLPSIGKWLIAGALLVVVGGGGAAAAYYALTKPSPAPASTSAVASSSSPVPAGLTRYESGLFGLTIDYDATKLFEQSFADRGEALFSNEQLNSHGFNFGPDAASSSPNRYKYSAYSLVWSYAQEGPAPDVKTAVANFCRDSDPYSKHTLQTLTLRDGTILQGCHEILMGGSRVAMVPNAATVSYFVEHPVTKKILLFSSANNSISTDAEAQDFFQFVDTVFSSVQLQAPSQAGYDAIKKADDINAALNVNPNKDAAPVVSGNQGTFKDNSLGIEVYYPSPTWYYKNGRIVSTEYKNFTPLEMQNVNDGADLLINWQYVPSTDNAVIARYKNCTTDNTPGESHLLTANGNTIYECVHNIYDQMVVDFTFKHPLTGYYLVFEAYAYGAPQDKRKQMLSEFEKIVTATTFFQPSSEALKQIQTMLDLYGQQSSQ